MSQKQQQIFEQQLADYFHQRLQSEVQRLERSPHPDTLWYVGSTLARLGASKQLFSYDEGRLGIRPLALLYQDALNTEFHQQRCNVLRQLGDLALFLGGVFPQSYARRGIEKDYFIGMGGSAYDYLAEHHQHYQNIFAELAATFAGIMELVAAVCSARQCYDATDILSLYQRWRDSKDPELADKLRELGISPGDDPGTVH
jgi:hypothetical protein